MKKIGIVIKPSKIDDIHNFLTNLIRWLSRRNKTIVFQKHEESRLQKHLSEKTFKLIALEEEDSFFKNSDLIISLGGDGTLLGVARNAPNKVPVFGINLGRLGFITEFSKVEFYEKLNTILLGKYESFNKKLFQIEVKHKDGTSTKEVFFNDAVISKNEIARMFTLEVDVDGEHAFNLAGDGLIISSTYGSTAYSLAAGGPIVHPDVKALIITPVCPHSLTHRPMVLPDSVEVEISVMEKTNTVHVTLDGQVDIPLHYHDKIVIRKYSKKSVTMIKNPDRTYFHTLKEKFIHGRRSI
ncbi:MAG: hypothetical protein CME62_02825 [Halobacteriovoraceae bacterium]|nr:hypothetical protein [Halobacteriovoraceae bacterium]|tara:strand:+ start:16760 stop:17650 length:891 start_codon:yes stop_codon:yes gene_type:complete